MSEKPVERLIVDGFAGMKHVELDIGRINLLIGPQATGKSVCAKLLYLFKCFPCKLFNRRISMGPKGDDKEDLDSLIAESFERYFPRDSWPSGAYSADYQIGELFVSVRRSSRSSAKPVFSYSHYFLESYREAWDEQDSLHEGQMVFLGVDGLDLVDRLFDKLKAKVGDGITETQTFVPAGRSFFANLRRNTFTILSTNNTIDPFLLDFGASYEWIRRFADRFQNKEGSGSRGLERSIAQLYSQILRGKYVADNDDDFLLLEDGRKVRVANASSGQQEMLPLALIFRSLAGRGKGNGNTLYVEEPEAHLFPDSQRSIVNLMATLFNGSSDPLQMVITTHSPYILAAFDNLVHAGVLARTLPKRKLSQLYKIVPKEQILDPADLRAYALLEGREKNLIDPETGLISADIIDGVSDELDEQFSNLLGIE